MWIDRVTLSAHASLCCWNIWKFGTEEQKMRYMVPLNDGRNIGASAIIGPNAGSDAGGTKTTAVKDGDSYVLNGPNVLSPTPTMRRPMW